MKKFKLISCLVIFPAVLLVACKSTIGATPTSTTHFAFNDTKTEYNGIDIIQKKLYSTISPSEMHLYGEKFTDPSNNAVFDSVVNNDFWTSEALQDGYIGFQRSVYTSLEDSINSVVRQDHGLFYDGILFPNTHELNSYAKTKKELFLKDATTSESVVLNSNGNKSEVINIDSLKSGSVIEKQKILNFLLKNAGLQIEIIGNNGTTRETVAFDTSNNSNEDKIASQIIESIDNKYIPVNYQKVSSNNNSGQFFVDLSNDDKYELYGPLIHQGSADIQGILHPQNWRATPQIPPALFRDQRSLLVSHAFDFLIGDVQIQDDKEVKKLSSNVNKEDFAFYFPYNENELNQTNKSTNLQLNLAWVEFINLLKSEQDQIYKNFVQMLKSLSKAQRYTSFHKTFITYSFLLDSLVNNNASENLIFLLKNFYIKLSNKIDSALEFLNSKMLPSGLNFLKNQDSNANDFSFKEYFGFGSKDFDLGANLDHLLPNIQFEYKNLNILFSLLYLSNALSTMSSAIIDKKAILTTIKGLKIDSDENMKNYYQPLLDKHWDVIEPLWWLINSQNLTQSLYILGYDTKNSDFQNLSIEQLVQVNKLNEIFSIKWVRNQVILTLVSEKIKEEINKILTYTPTDFFNEKIKNDLNKKYNLESRSELNEKIRNLFKDIPKNVLAKLKNINLDLQTLTIIKKMFTDLKKAQEAYNNRKEIKRLEKVKELQTQIEKYLESLYSSDYVDVYLRVAARFKLDQDNKDKQNETKNYERSITSSIHAGESKLLRANSLPTTSMTKTGDINAVLKNSVSQINLRELKALETNHVGESNRQKISEAINSETKLSDKVPNVNISLLITDSFTDIFASSIALSQAINNPNLINRVSTLIMHSTNIVSSFVSFSGNVLNELSNVFPKLTNIASKLGPIFSVVGAAVSLALFVFDVFYPKEEKIYYVFKSGNSEYVWTGGYKKTWLLGAQILERRTPKDIKLVGPIQIVRPQNESFLYYNKEKYSSSQVDLLRKIQIKEWLNNKNLYANADPDYLKGVRKIYSMNNNLTSVTQSFDQLYENIYNALTNNKILGIDQQKIQTINGQLVADENMKNTIYDSEVKNKTQKWTILEVPKTNLDNGLIFHKERTIKIENLVEFDNESGVGIAKGFGRYGNEGTEATFIITNKSMQDEKTKEVVVKKFQELFKPVKTKYLDAIGSRSQLIYESSLYEVFDEKIGKNLYFVSIADAKKYIDKKFKRY